MLSSWDTWMFHLGYCRKLGPYLINYGNTYLQFRYNRIFRDLVLESFNPAFAVLIL